METRAAGTLVRGRYILTSSIPAVIPDGAVRIVGAQIDAVGSWKDLSARFIDDAVVGGANDIVTPGSSKPTATSLKLLSPELRSNTRCGSGSGLW